MKLNANGSLSAIVSPKVPVIVVQNYSLTRPQYRLVLSTWQYNVSEILRSVALATRVFEVQSPAVSFVLLPFSSGAMAPFRLRRTRTTRASLLTPTLSSSMLLGVSRRLCVETLTQCPPAVELPTVPT